MAKITRIVARIFGSGAGVNQISKFGSLFAGSPAFTTDAAEAQSLSNWLTGWAGAAIGGNAPAIEDMNSVLFVLAYQIAYQMQAGVAEWDTSTVYYIGSLVSDGAGAIYVSKTDANTGNLLSDAANWKKVGGDIITTLGDLIYGATGGDVARLAGNITTNTAVLTQTGSGAASAAPVWREIKAPTAQKFLTGAGTYTAPVNPAPAYIRVRMVGGGGGGGGASATVAGGGGGSGAFIDAIVTAPALSYAYSVGAAGAGATGSGSGSAGGDTTFGANTAGGGGGGGGGGVTSDGGLGGAATLSLGSGLGVGGGGGGGGAGGNSGIGGSSALGGAGRSVQGSGATGGSPAANSGSGGAGGMPNGGDGASGAVGMILVEEFYI